MIIIVFGLPGSGKTYFASRLADAISAEYVNSDVERNKMLAVKTYSNEEKQAVYDHMLRLMKQAIMDNRDLVLDATFYKESIREKFLNEASGSEVVFIEVFASEEITRHRLSKKRDDSDADYNVYKKINSEWEPLQTGHLILESTNNNIDTMIATAADYIKKHQ